MKRLFIQLHKKLIVLAYGMNSTFLLSRIAATQAMIEAYETAITAISVGGVESYRLDTGQTSQTVTKINLSSMQSSLDGLYNRLSMLKARLYGTGTVIGRPAW